MRKKGKAFGQQGVRGQFCYADVESDTIIATFASHIVADELPYEDIFDPIIDYLKGVDSKKKKKGKKKGGKKKGGKKKKKD